MTKKSKSILLTIAITVLLFGWWISDIPIGYYQFKERCEKEGGLRAYEKAAPNIGWLAANEVDAKGVVQSYPTVPFTRFRSDDGVWKDVKYKGGYGSFSRYEVSPADETKSPQYRLRLEVATVPDAIRLRKEVLTLSDGMSNQIVFQTTRFIFTWTNPEKTLLGRSDFSGMSCIQKSSPIDQIIPRH